MGALAAINSLSLPARSTATAAVPVSFGPCGLFFNALLSEADPASQSDLQAIALKVLDATQSRFEDKCFLEDQKICNPSRIEDLCANNEKFRDAVRRGVFQQLLADKKFLEAEKVANTLSNAGLRSFALVLLGIDLGVAGKPREAARLKLSIDMTVLKDEEAFRAFFDAGQHSLDLSLRAINLAQKAQFGDAHRTLEKIPEDFLRQATGSMVALLENKAVREWVANYLYWQHKSAVFYSMQGLVTAIAVASMYTALRQVWRIHLGI